MPKSIHSFREFVRSLRALPGFIESVGVEVDVAERRAALESGVVSLKDQLRLMELRDQGEFSDDFVLGEHDLLEHVNACGKCPVCRGESGGGGVDLPDETSEVSGEVAHAGKRMAAPSVTVAAPFEARWFVVETTKVDGVPTVVMTSPDGPTHLTAREAVDLARALFVGVAYIGFPASEVAA